MSLNILIHKIKMIIFRGELNEIIYVEYLSKCLEKRRHSTNCRGIWVWLHRREYVYGSSQVYGSVHTEEPTV